MQLGLGNSLVKSGLSNPDKLSLDLQFAADKTLTARRGPTPVFSRGTGATYVGSDGLIKYGPENLSPSFTSYSKVQIQTPASISDGITADSLRYTPTGTPTGYMFTSFTFVQATLVTLSCFIRSSNLTTFNFRDFASPAKNSRNFDPTTGLWAASGGDTQFTSYTVLSFGNGWYRISCNYLPTDATASRFFGVMIGQNAATSVDLGGMQIERCESARTYIPTTTAAVYGPRFDHDPVTLDCKGLLIEEGRENFIINSDLYSSATPTNITTTTITGTSVTGSNQIRELSLTSSGVFTGVQFNATGTGTGSKTLSVFIKKPASNAAPYFTIGFASSAFIYAGIQLTMSGSIPVVSVTSTTAGGFSVVSSAIEAFPNNWYRVSVVVSGTPASCFPTMYPSNAVWNGTSDIRQTLVASGTNLIYIWGAQLEAGAFPTSYIPTTTGTAARSADVCSISGGAFAGMYNATEGTFISDSMIANLIGDNRGIAQIDSGTSDNVIRHQYSSSSGGFNTLLRANVDAPTILSATTGAVSTIQKRATAYAGTNFASTTNGGLVTTATRTFPVGLNTLRIGSILTGSLVLNGHIASIRYYKKRLPNARLIMATDPNANIYSFNGDVYVDPSSNLYSY